MNTYCTNCGTKKEDNGNLLCDECLSRAETAGTADVKQNGAAVQMQGSLQWNQYWETVKRFAAQPVDTARAVCSSADAKHGAIVGLAASLIMALLGMLLLRKVWLAFLGIFGGGMGLDLIGSALFGPISFPYGEVFFKLLMLFIIQWLLLALVVTVMSKLAGVSVRFVQSMNVVAYTKLIMAACLAAGLILSFIYTPLAIAVMAGGMLAGYLLIDKTITDGSESASAKGFYYMPAVFVVYFTAMSILSKLFF